MSQVDERGQIRSYLLGGLDEAGQEEVEMRLLFDAGYVERVSAAQNELVDDYVFGTLSAAERERFEQNFLSTPERLRQLRIARALETYADRDAASLAAQAAPPPAREEVTPPPTRLRDSLLSFFGKHRLKTALTLPGALLLFAAGYGLWSVFQDSQMHGQFAQILNQRAQIEQELAGLNHPPTTGINSNSGPHASAPAAVSLTLKLISVRGAESSRRARVPAEAQLLRLQLEVGDYDYQDYSAAVSVERGPELFTIEDLKPSVVDGDKSVVIQLPAQLLPTGNYQVRLSGVTADGAAADARLYPFEVVKK